MMDTPKITVVTGEDDGGKVLTLCRLTSDGTIQQMRTRLVLRSDRGEYYPMKARDESGNDVYRKVITAQAFSRINNLLGVVFSSPPTIQIGKDVFGNPHFSRDGASVQRVTVRRVGFGRNITGNLVFSDLTLTLDLDDYLATEVWDAWKPWRAADKPKPWGRVSGTKFPDLKPTEKEIACPGGIYLAVNLLDQKVISLWSQHMQRQKFAERNAVSICERNILKRFLGQSYAGPDGSVVVTHWSQPDRNRHTMESIIERIQRGEVTIEGESVKKEESSEVVDIHEAKAALSGEGEDAPEPEDGDDPVAGIEADVRKQLNDLWKKASKDKRAAALSENGFKSAAEVAKCSDDMTIGKVVKSLAKD